MRKTIHISTLLLILLAPIAALLLSFNLTFRLPVTYNFFFTDTRAVGKLGYEIEDNEVTKEIVSYLSNPRDSEFQVYEQTGKYRDKVFSETDQQAMANAKQFLFKEGIVALVVLAVMLGIIFFVAGKAADDRDLYQFTMRGVGILGAIFLALQAFLPLLPGVRSTAYRVLFGGVKLSKNSALHILVSAGFTKTYCVISLVLGMVLLLLFLYLCYRRYRPRGRIFY